MRQKNRTLYKNARLLDPATGLDIIGDVLVEGMLISDFGANLSATITTEEIETIDLKIGDILEKYNTPLIEFENEDFLNPYMHVKVIPRRSP